MARKRFKQSFCKNCNTPFEQSDNYCKHCGQENHSPNLPIKHLFLEIFEAFTHLDSKVFLTYKNLFLHPGQYTSDYINNRRMRYIPPIRLYIFTSAVFFFLLQAYINKVGDSVTDTNSSIIKTEQVDSIQLSKEKTNSNELNSENGDSINLNDHKKNSFSKKENLDKNKEEINILNLKLTNSNLESIDYRNQNSIDSLIRTSGKEPNFFNRLLLSHIVKTAKVGKNSFYEIGKTGIKNLSIALFLLMPIFGLILAGLYYHQHRNYYEFLIISINYHTLYFLLITLSIIINHFIDIKWIFGLTMLGLFIYLILGLKNMFKQSFKKTFLKAFICCTVYSFILTIAVVLSFIVGWLMS